MKQFRVCWTNRRGITHQGPVLMKKVWNQETGTFDVVPKTVGDCEGVARRLTKLTDDGVHFVEAV